MNRHAYLQALGRYAEACTEVEAVIELNPNQVVALVSLAMFRADEGSLDDALAIARRAFEAGEWFVDTRATLAAMLRRTGDDVSARRLRETFGSGDTFGDARTHAIYHLLCGDVDAAVDWVVRAIEERDVSMMFYLRFIVSKGLRASSHWPMIAQGLNLPPSAFA